MKYIKKFNLLESIDHKIEMDFNGERDGRKTFETSPAFNQLFEANYNKDDIEILMSEMSVKYCIKGMLYILKTTNYDPNYNVSDGTILNYIDIYESKIQKDEIESLIELVDLLIKKGANINALDIDGRPPISITNQIEITRLLLDADCDLNIIGEYDDLDTLEQNLGLEELVKKEYPEKYKKYLKKKKSNNFNI